MANYSCNQVRQFYVANAYNASVTPASAEGTLGGFNKIEDILGDQIYFLYKGADKDTVLKSDFIPIKNIGYACAIPAAKMATGMRKIKLELNSNINGGNPVAGQDYILGINFKNFFSSGDDSQYYKDAAVHATAAMAADKKEFYKAMVKALNAAFSREYGASPTSNPYLAFSAGTAGSEDGVYIEEKPQEWELGTKKARRIMFDVFPKTIYTSGDDVIWAEDVNGKFFTELTPSTVVGNGQKIADLEWFCAGERGDQYRMVGWPNYVPTKYLVDPSKTYNVLEIHYAFTDTGVNSYRTEKEITIVSDNVAVLNNIIGEINTQTGLNIATL